MKVDTLLLTIFSEVFVDLSAGWLGAVLIVPNFASREFPFNFAVLTGDLLAAISSLVIAFRLRKLSKEKL